MLSSTNAWPMYADANSLLTFQKIKFFNLLILKKLYIMILAYTILEMEENTEKKKN